MKNLYLIILILILIFCSGFSEESVLNIKLSYQPNVEKLESIFKAAMPSVCGIVFTKVPRGLIVSIDEDCFFNDGEARIKESALYILDIIACLLCDIPNYCVVENHTENNNFENSYYSADWELSMARSANIVEYFIKYKKIPSERLFSLGYGQYMPFKDNVGVEEGMNGRIDFVMLEYEAKR